MGAASARRPSPGGPFTVYHSQLRTPNGRYDGPQQDRALIITYRRDIDREALVEATRDQWQAQGILQQEPRSEAWLRMLQGIWPDVAPGSQLAFVVSGGEGQFWYRASAAQTAFTPARPAPVGGVQHPLSRHLARSAHHLSRTASAVDRRYTMKRILTLGLALLMLILAGCSTEVTEYRQQQPALDIFHYFQGRTEAWGMVQDRSGKQLRRFHVAIDGDVVGDTLTLHERFVYDDGEKQQRIWRIRRTGDNRYQGTAGDIEGVASGQAAGNAFHWRYSMNVEASGSRWLLHFDDWMFLQDGSHLFNKTEMKKLGITVATVTLFFTRTTAEERTAP
ncbi:lipoprotein [Klebsiella pneumoniae subsp. ozaenae]|uniref:Lipoprotein n=6 Tax=Enterobacterales TaxID=91347 RepID=A0A378C596_KLEPO|nr:lipoprotein [Klebsiella pneumoniae subsp. ozaenae]